MRTLGLGTCVIALMAISALLNQESGVGIWLELREDLSGSAARVAQLLRENDEMRQEIQMLEDDPAALDRAIREELDVALPGEIVVRFARSVHAGVPRPATNDAGRTAGGALSGDWTDRETR